MFFIKKMFFLTSSRCFLVFRGIVLFSFIVSSFCVVNSMQDEGLITPTGAGGFIGKVAMVVVMKTEVEVVTQTATAKGVE